LRREDFRALFKRDPGFGRSELQKTVARSSLEGASQALGNPGVEGLHIGAFDYCEAAMRRQRRSNRDGTHAGESTSLTDYRPAFYGSSRVAAHSWI